MQIILLSITDNLRKETKPDSILNHFQEYNHFYFSIPMDLSVQDQTHLFNQSTSFFQSQFISNIENHISLKNKGNLRKIIQNGKKISWEIFYRFNRWIRACEGVFDKDLNLFISGFTGKIIDFYVDNNESIYLIAFSGDSISRIPFNQLSTISQNTSPFYAFLASELIMPDFEPKNLMADDKKKTNLLFQLTNAKDYQQNNFDNFYGILKFWEDQFRSNLTVSEPVRLDSSQHTGDLLVDIPYFCERFGVWGTFLIENQKMDIPLMEIEEITNNKSLNELFHEYQKIMSFILPN